MQVAFACIPILIMLRRDGGLGRMRAAHPRLIVLRGFLAGIGTIFGFYAFSGPCRWPMSTPSPSAPRWW